MTDRSYSDCISLGWFCGTAGSMAKLGLRSHSGPFDWYYSDYWAVLKQMESDFSDFMRKENLKMIEERTFCDLKYGFRCNHDIKCDLESEYDEIYERYMRRDFPVISFENVSDGAKIFIAIESPKANEEILSQILQSHTVTKVVGYADVERVIKKMVPDADI